jgi:hypothetical protein
MCAKDCLPWTGARFIIMYEAHGFNKRPALLI